MAKFVDSDDQIDDLLARVAELERALAWAIDTIKANPIDGPGFSESLARAQDALKEEGYARGQSSLHPERTYVVARRDRKGVLHVIAHLPSSKPTETSGHAD